MLPMCLCDPVWFQFFHPRWCVHHQNQIEFLLRWNALVVGEEWWTGWICGVGDIKIPTEHLIVEFTEDSEIVWCFVVPDFHDCIVVHWSANMAKCASTTRSMTSSVAERFHWSHTQSTHISAGSIVSNMKFSRPKRMCCLRVGSIGSFVMHLL